MCLAIYQPTGVVIPDQTLHQGWIYNPDGAGFAFLSKGKVVIRKGYMTYKEFIEAYKEAKDKYNKSPFLIHFRIRSMGSKEAENTHPFAIKGGALIHNGTMTGTGATGNTGHSDTNLFAKIFADKMPFDVVNEHKEKWERALNSWNKVAILYDNGKYIILNEQHGHWVEGAWFSNKHHCSSPRNNGPWGHTSADFNNNMRAAYGIID